jgi:hypothetical protein
MSFTLILVGKVREAIEHVQTAMRLDPLNPARYLFLLGFAQYCLGDTKEAIDLMEKAVRLNPSMMGPGAVPLVAAYAREGRDQEAEAVRVAVDRKLSSWYERAGRLRSYLGYLYPFTDRALADRFAEDLGKGGVQGPPPWPHEVWEKLLTGKEIQALLRGATMSIVDPYGLQGSMQMDGSGSALYSSSDYKVTEAPGKVRIEGDLLCQRYEHEFIEFRMEFCSTVFRNPQGTPQGRDEYILVGDQGIWTASIRR